MSKKLNEDYSVLKNPSPFQIGRAPGFQRDKTPELDMQYQIRRSEEAATFYQKKIMVAQLEALEVPLMQLFQDITKIRNIIAEKKRMQLIPKDKLIIMGEMEKKLDKVNEIISGELLMDLDKLTLVDDEGEEEEEFPDRPSI